MHVGPPGSPREQASDPPERQAENTILVVNDEPELLELMCRLLRKSGKVGIPLAIERLLLLRIVRKVLPSGWRAESL